MCDDFFIIMQRKLRRCLPPAATTTPSGGLALAVGWMAAGTPPVYDGGRKPFVLTQDNGAKGIYTCPSEARPCVRRHFPEAEIDAH